MYGCSQEAEQQAQMNHLRERLPTDRKGLQDPLRKVRVCRGLRRAEGSRPGSWLTTGGQGLQAREVTHPDAILGAGKVAVTPRSPWTHQDGEHFD